MKTILKYITLAILGATIFTAVNATRTSPGFGGEAVFLALPVMWWAFERTFKDWAADFKRMRDEIREEKENRADSER